MATQEEEVVSTGNQGQHCMATEHNCLKKHFALMVTFNNLISLLQDLSLETTFSVIFVAAQVHFVIHKATVSKESTSNSALPTRSKFHRAAYAKFFVKHENSLLFLRMLLAKISCYIHCL